ncbi:tetratricopeptide repeat protein [Breoghania sp. L-A4]|uniref:tetratricopeptide repeat protein n=1 Tax=Breoghania sp. L-A4 TaxID=2304600 RepID=UPI000E359448|nr:tetratricopeptide repeat protein [Breoghania sp. L-A4]AXS41818.1 sel1 repeat family protein [Breoghania sp. L-A4]
MRRSAVRSATVSSVMALPLILGAYAISFAATEQPAAPLAVPSAVLPTTAGGVPKTVGTKATLPMPIRVPPQAFRSGEDATRSAAPEPGEKQDRPDRAYGAFQRGYYLTALALATRRAQQNDPAAQTLLGVLYERGIGVDQDVAKSASWYALAAARGDAQAAYRLGLYHLLGSGVPRDEAKAAELFEQASKSGLAGATYNLGVLHMEGTGIERDPAKALALFKQAATDGDQDAQYALAQAYLEEDSVQRDERLGAFWMGRAARGGHVAAQVYYGIMRYNGTGVEPDKKDAAQWFQRAATSGNPVAMNRLARLYAYGEGVGHDALEAATWHLIARATGISDLRLDGYVESLDAETRTKAAERAAQWTGSIGPGTQAQAPATPAQ